MLYMFTLNGSLVPMITKIMPGGRLGGGDGGLMISLVTKTTEKSRAGAKLDWFH